MCESCQVVFDREFGNIEARERDYILWNLTAFPFADPAYFETQVTKLSKFVKPGTDGWWDRVRFAEDHPDAAIETVRRLFGKRSIKPKKRGRK